MVKISGTSFYGGDDGKPKKTSRQDSFNEFRQDVFTSYKNFKQQVGTPLTNKTNHPPVYYPKQQPEPKVMINEHGTNQEPVYYNETQIVPKMMINEYGTNQEPVYYQGAEKTEASPVKPSKDELPLENQRQVKSRSVSGTYTLTEGENGKGFSLTTNMTVGVFADKELKDLFYPKSGMLSFEKTKDGMYTYRGLKAKSPNALNLKLQGMAEQVAIRKAVYNDLMEKQNSGVELSSAEQSFVKHYMGLLDKLGIRQDENGSLIEK